MATQIERRRATRGRLLEAARHFFVARGFESTSTGEILDAAGVSRGALYHHFATKQDLFEAVFEDVSSEAIRRALSGLSGQGSARSRLVAGCMAWLVEARRPEVRAILLDQGPAVLGWQRARELENRSSLGLMKAAVGAGVEEGEFEVASVHLLASILNAVIAEIALAELEGEAVASEDVERTLDALLAGFVKAGG
jgi:AcrR family transcriptional regulator